jgi:tRNA U54 and U55 pseudouridine synthase Pus10
MAEKYGRRNSSGIELCVKLSHQEMASIIGSTRETVTVMLGQLQNEGVIEVNRRRITIVDLQKLSTEINEPLSGIESKLGSKLDNNRVRRPRFSAARTPQNFR